MSKNLSASVVSFPSGGVPTGIDPCLISFAVDPTAGAGVPAPIGSIGSRTDVPSVYQKTAAADTAWTLLAVVAGATSLLGQVTFGGIISPAALAAATTNDWNPAGLATASIIRVDLTVTNRVLTGIVAQPAGTLLILRNVSDAAADKYLWITHEGLTSAAANRFALPAIADWYLAANGAMAFVYDGTLSRWVPFDLTNRFPGTSDAGSASSGITVGPPSEMLGLRRNSAQVLAVQNNSSTRFRLSIVSADPNPAQFDLNTILITEGQTRTAGVESPAAIAGGTNDRALNAKVSVVRQTTAGAATLTGLAGGFAGREITYINIGADDITLTPEDGASVAANRFAMPANVLIGAGGGVAQLWYDGASARWRVSSSS